MELSGPWRAAPGDDVLRRQFTAPDFDDGGWAELAVPGHWRSAPGFEHCRGPVLYRRRFDSSVPGDRPGRRSFLVLEGCFYQGDVWLDGSYLGDTEGYFLPHAFEVTGHLGARREHVLAVELACATWDGGATTPNLTGMLQGGPGVDPAWNPGGIWRPVRLVETGPVRITSLRVRCAEATPDRARLRVTAELDSACAAEVELRTAVTAPGTGVEHHHTCRLTGGVNEVSWEVEVLGPPLWWPRALGPAQLVDVEMQAMVGAELSDSASRRTGLRQVRMRDWVLEVNGERIFLKGAGLGPTRMALAETTVAEVERDVRLAQEAGLDLLRVHAHIAPPELYDAADRAGMLLWQDLPVQGVYGRRIRHQALRQARAAVDLLAHHPSLALWCGHDRPFPEDPGRPRPWSAARLVRHHVLPSWNRTVLDAALARGLEVADGTRPVLASAGVLPHAARRSDTDLGLGWRRGEERDLPDLLRRLPVLARFVSGIGAQAVPATAAWMEPERWPDLDWDRLRSAAGMDKAILDDRVPTAAYPTFQAWQAATQELQATLLRHHVEAVRRLKYRPAGGFCQQLLADSHPAVSASVLDHERAPKAGYAALADACAPVIVTADRLAPLHRPGDGVALDVHVVSDLRRPLEGCTVRAHLAWPGGSHRWGFTGDVPADAVARVATLSFVVPDAPGPLTLDLRLEGPVAATASYASQILPTPS